MDKLSLHIEYIKGSPFKTMEQAKEIRKKYLLLYPGFAFHVKPCDGGFKIVQDLINA